jgi:hypothetical protein
MIETFFRSPDHPFRCLYVMRGIPGCGKTHRAKRLALEVSCYGRESVICSADHFFGEGEEYKKNWSRDRVYLGHRDCEAKAKEAAQRGVASLIIDNTNVTLQNFKFYLDLAVDSGYSVVFAYPTSLWWEDTVLPFLRNKKGDAADQARGEEIAQTLADKNIHGVPAATLVDMMMRWTWPKFDDYVLATRQRVESVQAELTSLQKRLSKMEPLRVTDER